MKKLLLLPPLLSHLIESVHYVKCFWDADVARRELSSLPKKQTAANLLSLIELDSIKRIVSDILL